MLEEMALIEDNRTWHLAALLPGHRATGLKWVYKVKKDAQGNEIKHKAHLIARVMFSRTGSTTMWFSPQLCDSSPCGSYWRSLSVRAGRYIA